MEKTTQVFLGVRMVCAQCHDHPFERWTQNQYYEMAAFFSAVAPARVRSRRGDRLRPAAGLRHEAPEGRPRDEAQIHRCRPTSAALPSRPMPRAGRLTPSGSRARTIRSSRNPPPTACGATSSDAASSTRWTTSARRIPPSNPALLDALTKDFVDHDFDLRHLMRTIANSRTYQAGIATNEWNEQRRR